MRLALCLGMTLAELSVRVSAKEFALWANYDRQWGLPDRRDELNWAIQTASIVNFAGRMIKEPRDITHYMPFSTNRVFKPEDKIKKKKSEKIERPVDFFKDK